MLAPVLLLCMTVNAHPPKKNVAGFQSVMQCADPLGDTVNRFPPIEVVRANMGLARMWVNLQPRAHRDYSQVQIWQDLLMVHQAEPNVRALFLKSLQERLDAYDTKYHIKTSSFERGRMPNPFPWVG
jgi:hypothetical protein